MDERNSPEKSRDIDTQALSAIALANKLGDILVSQKLRVAVAESCTGGQIATSLCAAKDTPEFFGCGFVTFTDEAKSQLLGVKPQTLARWTAVSEQTAIEMAEGARNVSRESVSLAVTGYAGPDGGEDGTPAGTVWFAWCLPGQPPLAVKRLFEGDSKAVLEQAVKYALAQLIALLE
ncbi:2-oxo-tetronate isomerase [Vagococcus sp. WN89Y]|uniref:2-oxo-tetronate isomerase n=1 Tax=Vagococcus sp. WN89Y TaxID=3457258 RepID=UPI003FCC8C29